MNISKKMQDAFNAQITAELYSSNLYLQMAFNGLLVPQRGLEGLCRLDV